MQVDDKLLTVHVTVTATEVSEYCSEYLLCELHGSQLYVFDRQQGQLIHHRGTGSDTDTQGYMLAVTARDKAIRKLGLDWPLAIIKPKSGRTVRRERALLKTTRESKRLRPRA